MMLNKYMKSNEYYEEIEKAVDANPEYKAQEKVYLNSLESLNLGKEAYNSIDASATLMMASARELAYKKGFHDGVKLVADCMSTGKTPEIKKAVEPMNNSASKHSYLETDPEYDQQYSEIRKAIRKCPIGDDFVFDVAKRLANEYPIQGVMYAAHLYNFGFIRGKSAGCEHMIKKAIKKARGDNNNEG